MAARGLGFGREDSVLEHSNYFERSIGFYHEPVSEIRPHSAGIAGRVTFDTSHRLVNLHITSFVIGIYHYIRSVFLRIGEAEDGRP